jgi:hypothetical protein
MAWFSYKCPAHGEFRLSLVKRQKVQPCPTCSVESIAVVRSGTSRIVEILDNGVMERRVEALKDIEDILEARNDKFKSATELMAEEDGNESEEK